MKGPGVSVLSLWYESDLQAPTAIASCHYDEAPDVPPPAVAFAPGCPAADSSPLLDADRFGGRGGVAFQSITAYLPAGVGGYFMTPSRVTSFGATALWLPFND